MVVAPAGGHDIRGRAMNSRAAVTVVFPSGLKIGVALPHGEGSTVSDILRMARTGIPATPAHVTVDGARMEDNGTVHPGSVIELEVWDAALGVVVAESPIGYCAARAHEGPGPRITVDQGVMGGQPCISGTRVPVALILALLADGVTRERLLEAYPSLCAEDVAAALSYAAELAAGLNTVARGA